MPFACERCNKQFRDRCNLTRHLARKNPCIQTDTSGITIINNGTINGNININIVKNESISTDIPEQLVNYMRETLKLGGEEFDGIRALKWISELHKQISKNPTNQNIELTNIKSMTAKVLTEQGWVTRYTNDLAEEIFKLRSSQLVDLRGAIDQYNPKVLTAPTIKRTMTHVSAFKQHGFNHTASGLDRVRTRSEFKVAMLTQQK